MKDKDSNYYDNKVKILKQEKKEALGDIEWFDEVGTSGDKDRRKKIRKEFKQKRRSIKRSEKNEVKKKIDEELDKYESDH